MDTRKTVSVTCIAISLIAIIYIYMGTANAEQTVKTIELPIGYLDTANKDVVYSRIISFYPPDGVDEVIYAQIYLRAMFNSNTNIQASLNKEECTPSSINVKDKTSYEAVFDCTDAIDHAGNYSISFSVDKEATNCYAYYKMTYYNNPVYEMKLSGTEYGPDDEGLLFLQLLDNDNEPISSSSCYASVYYPFGTVWKYKQFMSYVDEGLYYYTFTTPYVSGVYMVSAYCVIPGSLNATKYVSDDFESASTSGGSGWSGNWALNGANFDSFNPYQGSWDLLLTDDDYPQRTFNGTSNDTSIDYSFYWLLYSLEIGETFYVWLIDASGTNFLLLQSINDDNLYHLETGSLYADVDSINLSGDLIFKINTSGDWEPDDYAAVDLINITLRGSSIYNTTDYQIVRGSGEVHVSSDNLFLGAWTGAWMNTSAGYEYGGTLYANYTITSLTQNNRTVTIDIEGFPYYTCEDIYVTNFWNDSISGWQDIPSTDYTCQRDAETGSDMLYWDTDLDVGQQLIMNFELRNKYWTIMNDYYMLANGSVTLGDMMCQYYANATGQNLAEIPLNSSYTEPTDYLLTWCNYMFDDFYYINETYSYAMSLNLSQDNPNSLYNFGRFQSKTIQLVEELYPKFDINSQSILDIFTESALYDNERVNAIVGYPLLSVFGNLSTNDIIREELNNLDSDVNTVYEAVVSVNDTVKDTNQNLYDFISLVNQSVNSKLDSVETNIRGDISSVNASISNELYQIQSDIDYLTNLVNTLNFSETNLSDVYNRLDRNYNKTIDAFTQVNLSNQSIMTKLYSMQDELADIYSINTQINDSLTYLDVNLTPVIDFLEELNASIEYGFTEVNDNQLAINQSIMNKLYGIQGELSDIYTVSVQTNNTVTEISVRIEEINASTMNYLYGMKSDLTDILNDISDVYDLVEDVNISIDNRIDQISTDIDNLGTQIDNVNISIHNKIDQLTYDLANQLANITNVTLNITADLEEVANDVWTLFFKRGTPPLAPSTDYYCDINNTEILHKNITYQFVNGDGSTDYFSKVEDINCGFGCVEGDFITGHATCDSDPTTKTVIAFAIVIALGVALWFIIKHTGGEEE